jgi:hypothetical protein
MLKSEYGWGCAAATVGTVIIPNVVATKSRAAKTVLMTSSDEMV